MTAARKPSAAPPSGFTPGEWTEFRNLLREPQPTFGSSRSRMQNALVRKGFAEFVEVDGSDRCSATPAGREAARRAPSPPPGFTGVRFRVLAAAVDGPHHVTLAVYRFPPGDGDPPGPIDVPYVELHETHDGARPARVMALSTLVHLAQNASDDEVWEIGGRETPGKP